MRYASATSVRRLPVTTTSGRHGRLSRADRSRISFAPADMFGVVDSILPSAGRTSGSPALRGHVRNVAETARARRLDHLLPAVDVRREVRPVRARVDDDADQRRSTRVGQQHRVFPGPVVGRRVVRDDHRVPLVDRQRPVREIRPASMLPPSQAAISRAAAAESADSQPARRQRSVSFMRSKVGRNTLCGNRAWNWAAARCASS